MDCQITFKAYCISPSVKLKALESFLLQKVVPFHLPSFIYCKPRPNHPTWPKTRGTLVWFPDQKRPSCGTSSTWKVEPESAPDKILIEQNESWWSVDSKCWYGHVEPNKGIREHMYTLVEGFLRLRSIKHDLWLFIWICPPLICCVFLVFSDHALAFQSAVATILRIRSDGEPPPGRRTCGVGLTLSSIFHETLILSHKPQHVDHDLWKVWIGLIG